MVRLNFTFLMNRIHAFHVLHFVISIEDHQIEFTQHQFNLRNFLTIIFLCLYLHLFNLLILHKVSLQYLYYNFSNF